MLENKYEQRCEVCGKNVGIRQGFIHKSYARSGWLVYHKTCFRDQASRAGFLANNQGFAGWRIAAAFDPSSLGRHGASFLTASGLILFIGIILVLANAYRHSATADPQSANDTKTANSAVLERQAEGSSIPAAAVRPDVAAVLLAEGATGGSADDKNIIDVKKRETVIP